MNGCSFPMPSIKVFQVALSVTNAHNVVYRQQSQLTTCFNHRLCKRIKVREVSAMVKTAKSAHTALCACTASLPRMSSGLLQELRPSIKSMQSSPLMHAGFHSLVIAL
jgi:hypothetical protein